jgi:hypothetical protein
MFLHQNRSNATILAVFDVINGLEESITTWLIISTHPQGTRAIARGSLVGHCNANRHVVVLETGEWDLEVGSLEKGTRFLLVDDVSITARNFNR